MKVNDMKERPILFSAPMVRALLDGSKVQTRRTAKLTDAAHVKEPRGHRRWHPGDPDAVAACPYGQSGDRLWVRETWAMHPDFRPESRRCVYRADPGSQYDVSRWTPAIHMFRWASRITLEITGVRVERLLDISDEDSLAEGIYPTATGLYPGAATAEYKKLWESINGPGSWAANLWVWVIEFKVLQK